jgi:hypothetical protein
MIRARLALGAALLLGAAPFAGISHAKCASEHDLSCTVATTVCQVLHKINPCAV